MYVHTFNGGNSIVDKTSEEAIANRYMHAYIPEESYDHITVPYLVNGSCLYFVVRKQTKQDKMHSIVMKSTGHC